MLRYWLRVLHLSSNWVIAFKPYVLTERHCGEPSWMHWDKEEKRESKEQNDWLGEKQSDQQQTTVDLSLCCRFYVNVQKKKIIWVGQKNEVLNMQWYTGDFFSLFHTGCHFIPCNVCHCHLSQLWKQPLPVGADFKTGPRHVLRPHWPIRCGRVEKPLSLNHNYTNTSKGALMKWCMKGTEEQHRLILKPPTTTPGPPTIQKKIDSLFNRIRKAC